MCLCVLIYAVHIHTVIFLFVETKSSPEGEEGEKLAEDDYEDVGSASEGACC